jgi:hypothetical protein
MDNGWQKHDDDDGGDDANDAAISPNHLQRFDVQQMPLISIEYVLMFKLFT